MAPPWPSQRRAGTSERHSALARMRDRRAGRASPDADEEGWPPPRPPVRMKGSGGGGEARSLPPPPRGGTGGSEAQPAAPWSPAWTPSSPRPRLEQPGLEEPPPPRPAARPPPGEPPRRRPSRGGERDEAPHRSQASRDERPMRRAERALDRAALEDSPSGGGRSRGSRSCGGPGDDDDVPAAAKGADFKTLQEMIARGIQDSETGASKLEAALSDDEAELKRHREQMRKRREEEAAARQKEKEAARQKRRREEEERRRRQMELLEEEEVREQRAREQRKGTEQQCRREFAAAACIQAHFRGKRSRAGTPVEAPAVVAKLHSEPWVSSTASTPSSQPSAALSLLG